MRFILPFIIFILFLSPAFAGGGDLIIDWWEEDFWWEQEAVGENRWWEQEAVEEDRWWEQKSGKEQKPVQKKRPQQKTIESIQKRLKNLGEMIEQRQLRLPPKEFRQRKK